MMSTIYAANYAQCSPPPAEKFNKGIWLEMGYLTTAWAQEYGSVWVITGPVVLEGQPSGWIGQGG